MKYLILFFLVLTLASCKKPDEYPIIPAISYNNLYTTQNAQGLDQSLSVILDFTDGDGDIGYKEVGQNGDPFDTNGSEYYNNYKGSIYKYTSGNWIVVPTGTLLQGRLPYLTPEGNNKSLKGQIQCDFLLLGLVANSDTFKMELFIYDRGLHKSNIITTPSFTLRTQ